MAASERSLLQRFRDSLRQRGALGTSRALWEFLAFRLSQLTPAQRRAREQDLAFDRWFGTDTAGKIDLNRLRIESANTQQGLRYQGTMPEIFAEIFARLRIPYERFTFIDLGSGKGRALLLAADYPFQKIIGVEFSRELHKIALNNFHIYHSPTQKCRNLESVLSDVTQYPIPDDNLVLYLNNPFLGKVMGEVLDRVQQSWQQHPRDIYFIYRNPTQDNVVAGYAFLKKIVAEREYSIYRSVPLEP